MKTLTIITATLYALGLWLFAPDNIWTKEVKKAKSNRLKTPTPTPTDTLIQTPNPTPTPIHTPKPTPTPTPTQTPNPTPTAKETPTPTPTPTDTPNPIQTPTPTDTNWTVAKLRKEAQTQKINWKDRDGKPLKKNELMRILEV